MPHLVWFRTDLRIHDHPALSAAASKEEGVVAIFIATPKTWRYHEAAPIKLDFIARNLQVLERKLQELNIPLVILECPTFNEIPAILQGFCAQNGIEHVYFNEQYEIDEQRRDDKVTQALQNSGIQIHRFHDQLLVPPGMILSSKNEPIKVFTPFKKKWLEFVRDFVSLTEAALPKKQRDFPIIQSNYPANLAGFIGDFPHDLWPAGEESACSRLDTFLDERVQRYQHDRDFPAIEGTSRLSPYLAQGVVSIKHVYNQLKKYAVHEGENTWLNELIWREFFKHIMALYPHICCSKTLHTQYQEWPWKQDEKLLRLWAEGQTGFPIIDAAMRQLKAEGWMHNRLRMNVAMFLTKLMGVDWRLGESYFMQNLIDGDLAANNGGWQWSAGTGCDAAPYFRVFNPLLQSEKFDPQGEFIRRYCPELKDFDNYTIHAPFERNPLLAETIGYPKPILDYKQAREQAVKRKLVKLN